MNLVRELNGDIEQRNMNRPWESQLSKHSARKNVNAGLKFRTVNVEIEAKKGSPPILNV